MAEASGPGSGQTSPTFCCLLVGSTDNGQGGTGAQNGEGAETLGGLTLDKGVGALAEEPAVCG